MNTNNTKGSLLGKETETRKTYVRCWKSKYNKKVSKKYVQQINYRRRQKNLIIN